MKRKVSILGCGWLGKTLALELTTNGWGVKGSVTSVEKLEVLQSAGITPFLIDLDKPDELPADFLSDQLIIAMPPGRNRNYAAYPFKIRRIIEPFLAHGSRVVLISSTAVYPKRSGNWKEEDSFIPDSETAMAIWNGESELLNSGAVNSVILRFAGLIDSDRNPATFNLSNRNQLIGNEPVNMIHRTDCIHILKLLLANKEINGVFNACADAHPVRSAFYEAAFRNTAKETPAMKAVDSPIHRIIDGAKLKTTLGFDYAFPDPVDFFR